MLTPTWARSAAVEVDKGIKAISGNEYDLEVSRTTATIDGRKAKVVTVNKQLPAPLLRWREGDDVVLRVTNRLDEAKIHGLYSKSISPFFDFQAGARPDITAGSRRTFGVVGIQGLAPYWFELDAALFISHEGDVSARVEAEYDMRFTQRLLLQPRAEVNLAVQNVESVRIGSGLSELETGARLRYEFRREVAPYFGVSWSRATGRTADFARQDGRSPGSLSVVAGLRMWF